MNNVTYPNGSMTSTANLYDELTNTRKELLDFFVSLFSKEWISYT